MAGKFELLSLIGTGTFGEAWVAKSRPNGVKCVIKVVKILKLSDKELDQSLTEVSILARMNHPNIVKYLDAYVENGALNIAMEYADGGDLHRKISNQKGIYFGKQIIVDWFVQICLALRYIHSQNILHRDLKTQNIFLTSDGKIKLGDFGIARVLKDSRDHAMTAIGTPFYLSPEICQKKPYNHKSDMWALGCVLYEMCCLHVPFDAEDFQGLILKILQEKYNPIPKNLGTTLSYLVTKLLDKNPDRRPSAEDILSMSVLKSFVQRHEPSALKKPITTALRSRSDSSNESNIPQGKGDCKMPQKNPGPALPKYRKDSLQCVKNEDKENIHPITACKTYLVQNPKFRHLSAVSPRLNKIVARQRRVHSAETNAECAKPTEVKEVPQVGKSKGKESKADKGTVVGTKVKSNKKDNSEDKGLRREIFLVITRHLTQTSAVKLAKENQMRPDEIEDDYFDGACNVQIWRDATDVLMEEEIHVKASGYLGNKRRSSYDPNLHKPMLTDNAKADKVRRSSLGPFNGPYSKPRSSYDPDGSTNRMSLDSQRGAKKPASRLPRLSMERRPSPVGSEFNRPALNVVSQKRGQRSDSTLLSEDYYSDTDEDVFDALSESVGSPHVKGDGKIIDNRSNDTYYEHHPKNIVRSKLIFGPQKREVDRAMRRSSSYDTIVTKKKKEFCDNLSGSPIQRAHSTGSIDKGKESYGKRDVSGSRSSSRSKTYMVPGGSKMSIPETGKF
ncbi:hypothetical protein FSP39_007941 [Pinctada imbricata]|uniref:non-specific serine/threonine protein kinase n=1 Tax=Pinctada imbricata TaxID=66713 RepID=A0AA88XZQ8_PINIB|nr:hypothetical protein FSP39_007941 [Pinctada imbricata]